MRIEKGNMIITDNNDNLIETKQGITCGCKNPSLTMRMHIDGTDFYSYQYFCSCGNAIEVFGKRNKEAERGGVE